MTFTSRKRDVIFNQISDLWNGMKVLLSGIVFYSDELQISFVTVMQREHHKEGREQITAAKAAKKRYQAS